MVDQGVIKGKVVLFTGGTGSLGQELTRQVLKLKPQSIRIYSRGEAYQQDMARHFHHDRLRFLIGDVRDKDRLHRAMEGVDIVVHAAALKQVPACEYNPIEAIKTNIDGAVNIIDVALDRGVEKVLAISSDKAVHPINLYGATKLVAEKLFTQANAYGETLFSCARFGNFWGSRGSIIPLLYEQKKQGVITLTDKDMSRFWITLEEASKFVIDCIERMEGAEVYIPIMPTHTLEEIASNIAPEAKIQLIGKRRGEKITELLLNEDEENTVIKEKDYWVVKNDYSRSWAEPLR